MQFTQENCDKVMSGRKTMTTRRNLPRGCMPGRTIAIQPGRGKYAVGRSMVITVWQVSFWDLAVQCMAQHSNVLYRKMDIKTTWYWREGFDTPKEFLQCLLSLAGTKADAGKMVTNDEKVWVIEFSKPVSINEIERRTRKEGRT